MWTKKVFRFKCLSAIQKNHLNNRGVSLVELLVGLGIMSIFSYLLSMSFIDIYKTNLMSSAVDDAVQYRFMIKNVLRERSEDSAYRDQSCMVRLEPLISNQLNTIKANLITDTSTAGEIAAKSTAKVDLGAFNILSDDLKFGDYEIQKTYLQNFYLVTSRRVFRKNAPGEVQRSSLLTSSYIIQIVQAEIFVDLISPKKTIETMKPVRINIAIHSSSNGDRITDCAYGNVSKAISHAEACKVLGSDFEFIYDKFDGTDGAGQCYAPIYDPPSAAAADGVKVMDLPTAYTPIRGTLCQMVVQGKSFTFPFCTGVN